MSQRPDHANPDPNAKPHQNPTPYPAPAPVPGWAQATQPVPPPRRRHPVLTHTLVAVMALGIGAAIGSAGGKSGTGGSPAQAGAPAAATTASAAPGGTAPSRTAAPSHSAAPAPSRAATTAAASAASVPGDGQYLVGQDMQPGTYRTKGPASDSLGMCYWERDKDSSGDMNSIIANDNLSGSGIVTVSKGEVFKSTGCQDWVRVG